MKNIKEKALDVYPKMSRISEPHGIIPACNKSHYLGDANEEKREGFETGANYAIDEIEKILPKEDKNLNDYGKALIWRIKDTIEQLRSNQ